MQAGACLNTWEFHNFIISYEDSEQLNGTAECHSKSDSFISIGNQLPVLMTLAEVIIFISVPPDSSKGNIDSDVALK